MSDGRVLDKKQQLEICLIKKIEMDRYRISVTGVIIRQNLAKSVDPGDRGPGRFGSGRSDRMLGIVDSYWYLTSAPSDLNSQTSRFVARGSDAKSVPILSCFGPPRGRFSGCNTKK